MPRITKRGAWAWGGPAALMIARGTEIGALLVRFGLSHDFLRGEVDAAGRKGIADEEVVGKGSVIIGSVLQVRRLDPRKRKLHRLRHDLAFERRDRRLDRHRHLGGTGATRRALQSLAAVFAAKLAKAVFRFAAERYERMLGIDHRLHD